MWRATIGASVENSNGNNNDDDWETDPDFVNDVTEEEQRWGSKTVEGSGRTSAAINIEELRMNVAKDDAEFKKKVLEEGPKPSYGYGGKFGVQADRMDRCAVGHDYVASVEKHASQTDAAKGFGGRFGVQGDRQDKSAVGWDYREKVDQHASQKDHSRGFGGRYGVQTDRVDRTAVGWDYAEKTEKHESQTDYARGFGGKFGLQTDRVDKSAHGWDYQEKTEKHPSQKVSKDYSKITGTKFGVQEEPQTHQQSAPSNAQTKPRTESAGSARELRSRFESLARAKEEEEKRRAEEERSRRIAREKQEREQAKRDEEERQRKLSLREQQRPPQEEEDEEEPVSSHRTSSMSVGIPTPLLQAATAASTTPPQAEPVRREEPVKQSYAQEIPVSKHIYERQDDFQEPVKHTSYTQEISYEEETHSAVDNTRHVERVCVSDPLNNFETVGEDAEDTLEMPDGMSAIALYDYQAADSDEISFDPDDVIINIEMIDEGWWRGECRGQVGLFPSNYVQLLRPNN